MSPFIRPPSVGTDDRRLARAVLFLLLGVFTLTTEGPPVAPETEALFQTVSAVCRTGSFALGGTEEAAHLTAAFENGEAPFLHAGAGPGEGEVYANASLGTVVGAVPFYFAGRVLGLVFQRFEQRQREMPVNGIHRSEYFEHLLFGWRNALFGALIGWALVMTARRLGIGRTASWISGWTFGVTTFAWAQARSGGEGVLAALLLILAFQLALRLVEAFDRLRSPSLVRFALLGGVLAAALFVSRATWPAVVVLNVWLVWIVRGGCVRLHEWRASAGLLRAPGLPARVLVLLLPQVVALGLVLAYNAARFGNVLDFGGGALVFEGPAAGAAGLSREVLSPGKGLLWLAPPALLACFSYRNASKVPWWPLTAMLLVLILTTPFVRDFEGPAFGPSSLLLALPFLWVLVAAALPTLGRGLRIVGGGLFLLGFVTAVPAALVDTTTYEDLLAQAVEAGHEGAPGGVDDSRWSLRHATPWAHWRILRHRSAGLSEDFPAGDIFQTPTSHLFRPELERSRGFAHLAWVDWRLRLAGPLWPIVLLVLAFFVLGGAFSIQRLE